MQIACRKLNQWSKDNWKQSNYQRNECLLQRSGGVNDSTGNIYEIATVSAKVKKKIANERHGKSQSNKKHNTTETSVKKKTKLIRPKKNTHNRRRKKADTKDIGTDRERKKERKRERMTKK